MKKTMTIALGLILLAGTADAAGRPAPAKTLTLNAILELDSDVNLGKLGTQSFRFLCLPGGPFDLGDISAHLRRTNISNETVDTAQASVRDGDTRVILGLNPQPPGATSGGPIFGIDIESLEPPDFGAIHRRGDTVVIFAETPAIYSFDLSILITVDPPACQIGGTITMFDPKRPR